MTDTQASTRAGADARTVAFRVWTVVGLIIIGVALLDVFGVLAPVIEFLAVGSLIAFVASPIVNSLEHRGVSRGIGSLVGLVVVLAVIACIVMVIVPIFTEQVMEILTRLPGQLRMLGDLVSQIAHDFKALSQGSWASDIDAMLSSLADAASRFVTQLAGDVGKGMVPFISQFASQIFVVFLALVLAYWLACDYPVIHREVGTIVGEDRETSYRFMIAILSSSVGGYMRGMIITSCVGGLLAFIGFVFIGHPYAALMGVVTGLFHLIPVVGPWFSSAISCLLAFFTDPMLALWTLIVTVVAQNVTDNIVSPKVMQSAVQVHPAMSLTALVVGSSLMGALGMVVAIPLCAALKGLFVFYFEKETKRQLVAYDGAIFKGTPFRNEQGEPVPAFDALGDDRFVVDSELIDTDSVPEATALPKPELDNPWARLASLQPGATGVFRNPFAQDTSDDAEQDDGR